MSSGKLEGAPPHEFEPYEDSGQCAFEWGGMPCGYPEEDHKTVQWQEDEVAVVIGEQWPVDAPEPGQGEITTGPDGKVTLTGPDNTAWFQARADAEREIEMPHKEYPER